MIKQSKKIYADGKKSLESLLREKAYSEVKEALHKKGVDINDISDEDIETLVASKTKEMISGIKGFSVGSAFAIVLSLITGL